MTVIDAARPESLSARREVLEAELRGRSETRPIYERVTRTLSYLATSTGVFSE